MEQNEVKSYITQSLFLLMKNVTYDKITMDMISKKAGVSRRTIYRYFINKQEILNYYFDELIKEYNKQLQNNFSNGSNVLMQSFEFIFNNVNIFLMAYKNGLLINIYNAIEDVVTKIVKSSQFPIGDKEYEDYYISFTSGGIYRILVEWLKNDGDKSPVQMFEIYKNVISDLDKRISYVQKNI